jgi:hypothetical protein
VNTAVECQSLIKSILEVANCIMSNKHSDDGDESDKSDSLICGFGPRRRGRAESTDDSTFAGASAGDNDTKEGSNALNSSLICGFGGGGGDGNSFASSGQSTGSDMLAALMEDEMNGKTAHTTNDQTNRKLGNGDHSAAENGSATSNNINTDVKNERDKVSRSNYELRIETAPLTVPTKTSSSPSGRRAIPRVSSNRSIGSEGDLSMASEDAIVLMSNLLEDSEDGSNDAMDNKAQNEIIGRVYKKRPSDKYDSIPFELEINPALWESMASPPAKHPVRQQDRRRTEVLGGAPPDKSLDTRLRRNSDGIVAAATMAAVKKEEERRQSSSPTAETKAANSALRAKPTIDKPLPNPPQTLKQTTPLSKKDTDKHQASVLKSPVRHVSLNGNVELSSQPPSHQTNSEPIKSYTVGFSTAVEPIQTRRRSSGMDIGLDVIAEDESDDSTAAISVLKSSQNSSKQASQSAALTYEDVIDEVFSMPTVEPLGEHAKSMAMQLGMVDRPKRKMCECDFIFSFVYKYSMRFRLMFCPSVSLMLCSC